MKFKIITMPSFKVIIDVMEFSNINSHVFNIICKEKKFFDFFMHGNPSSILDPAGKILEYLRVDVCANTFFLLGNLSSVIRF